MEEIENLKIYIFLECPAYKAIPLDQIKDHSPNPIRGVTAVMQHSQLGSQSELSRQKQSLGTNYTSKLLQ